MRKQWPREVKYAVQGHRMNEGVGTPELRSADLVQCFVLGHTFSTPTECQTFPG